jgi:hypothetical protein
LQGGQWVLGGGGANGMKYFLIAALLGVAMSHRTDAKVVRGEVPGKVHETQDDNSPVTESYNIKKDN